MSQRAFISGYIRAKSGQKLITDSAKPLLVSAVCASFSSLR